METESVQLKDVLNLFWVFIEGWDAYNDLPPEDRAAIIEGFVQNHLEITEADHVSRQINNILDRYGCEIEVDMRVIGEEVEFDLYVYNEYGKSPI